MSIPKPSNFPKSMDTDKNLFLVHDALRVRLMEDYSPGDTSILIEGYQEVIDKFPPTGIITLTEQCSEIDLRALTFYYNARTSVSFDELELLPEFSEIDSVKPKKSTNVTMNVVDMHHNQLKDALINTEYFLGPKKTKDRTTITGRINYLERVVFRPKVWFIANNLVGLVPLTVTFVNESFRIGEGAVTQKWEFGDGDPIYLTTNGQAEFDENKKIEKTYSNPGVYTVKLTVTNEYGENSVEFPSMVSARDEAPEPAVIKINAKASQSYTEGDPPKIRSVTNSFVEIEVPSGENPDTPGYSWAGEFLSGGGPVDPIKEYTWSLGDDLPHSNSNLARASYGMGGYYDIVLRVDTNYGSYRITKYNNSIDIVEATNLWLFNYTTNESANGSGDVQAYEFGLMSETFKTLGSTSYVNRSNGFLSASPLSYGYTDLDGKEHDLGNYYAGTYGRAKKEFSRNVEFVPAGTVSSGERGNSILFWAKGGDTVDEKEISSRKYNAFDDTYTSLPSLNNRPWNWAALNSDTKTYFLFGQGSSTIIPNQNPALAKRLDYDLLTCSAGTPTDLTSASFENGSSELLSHPSYFDDDGLATNGYFATYRTAWKDSTGYIMRNSSVNEFFRISEFYKTKGSVASPFNTITKMPDMVGSVKVEGELVALSNGVFMFNNSGDISAWNDTSLTWEVGRANSSSLSFRSVQDTSKSDFDNRANTLLAASDKDKMAYLSYDYSDKAFIKFNGTDLTFSTTRFRPSGTQFKMSVY